ncbi:MAG: PspA/IM30 family protein [Sphaerochaetaceae bacterium]|nr:PspA/IM30 family protein [Sphaerochaetaceae bacterium]
MGVFSRFMDIINSNINALLDGAENPEKLLKLMIQEMEDTIIEIKTSCASDIGNFNVSEKNIEELEALVDRWGKRAELAIEKGREDLAKEALYEKRKASEELQKVKETRAKYEENIETYKNDLKLLEEKLANAKAKLQSMFENKAYTNKSNSSFSSKYSKDTMDRFDRMEERIDRMNEKKNMEKQFQDLEEQASIEKEMEELKKKMGKN